MTTRFPIALLFLLGAVECPVPRQSSAQATAADPAHEKVLFEENFENGLSPGWSWVREIPDRWKIDKERKELLIRPSWSQGNLKNLLLRPLPAWSDAALAVEVHIDHVPVGDYEYCALLLYFDDENYIAIRKGPHGNDGKIISLVRMKTGKGDGPPSAPRNVICADTSVDLRLVISGKKAEGFYRVSPDQPWKSIGEQELPAAGEAKIGFRTGNGEAQPSWPRFSRFRVVQLK